MTTRKIIIVGATSGIGLATAKEMARRGWEVGIAGRREELLEKTEAEEENIKWHKAIDITKEDAPGKLKELISEMGGTDAYMHSSGIGKQNISLDEETELRTIETNCTGFTRMLTAAFNYFANEKGGKGQVAAITSIAGTKGLGAAPSYSASKRFGRHYLECLRQLNSIRSLNIKITDIRPGFVKTDLIKGSNYPLQLTPEKTAKVIADGIERKKRVITIDWKYRILVGAWKLIPQPLWEKMRVK